MARRILLLITDLQIGGTPTVVRELARRLNAPPEVVVDVACLAGPGPVGDQLHQSGVRVFPLDARGAGDWSAAARLATLIRAHRYDTVFSFLVHANVAAAAVAMLSPNVRFIQSIQTTQPYPRWHWVAQWVAHHAAEHVVVPSASVASAAGEWANVPPGKIVIIANAIDPLEFAEFSARTLPLAPQELNRVASIGFVGRLDPIKCIPDLIEAAGLLGGRVHLHVFGEGAERPNLENLIADRELGRAITLHGAVARPQEALRQIELLVLPSSAEGFGLVLIEAMAAGVPVIATDVPGIRDVVRHNQTGLLVPPGSPAALARAIRQVLDDPALCARLVGAASADVAERFTWDAVVRQYRDLLGLDASHAAEIAPPPAPIDNHVS